MTPSRGTIFLGYIDPETKEFVDFTTKREEAATYERFPEGNNRQIYLINVPEDQIPSLRVIPAEDIGDPKRVSFETLDAVVGVEGFRVIRKFVPHVEDFVRRRE